MSGLLDRGRFQSPPLTAAELPPWVVRVQTRAEPVVDRPLGVGQRIEGGKGDFNETDQEIRVYYRKNRMTLPSLLLTGWLRQESCPFFET